MKNLKCTYRTDHHKPNQHHRAKCPAHYLGTKLLEQKQQKNDTQDNQDSNFGTRLHRIGKTWHLAQPFNCRCNRNRWRDDTIGQQGTGTYNGRNCQPFAISAHQGIKRKNTAFTVVIGLQRNKNVLESGLQGKCPENTGYTTKNKRLGGIFAFGHQGLKHIQWRCTNVAENNSERDQHTSC